MTENVNVIYDVAFSYASEDRAFVEKVAEHLKARNIKLFYDRFEEVHLWGKELGETLDEIFRLRSRYVVLFISKHYAQKMWTGYERKSTLSRALRERREYVLPARFDETELPGLLPSVSSINLRGETPETFAGKIIQKITDSSPSGTPQLSKNGTSPLDQLDEETLTGSTIEEGPEKPKSYLESRIREGYRFTEITQRLKRSLSRILCK